MSHVNFIIQSSSDSNKCGHCSPNVYGIQPVSYFQTPSLHLFHPLQCREPNPPPPNPTQLLNIINIIPHPHMSKRPSQKLHFPIFLLLNSLSSPDHSNIILKPKTKLPYQAKCHHNTHIAPLIQDGFSHRRPLYTLLYYCTCPVPHVRPDGGIGSRSGSCGWLYYLGRIGSNWD